MKNLTLNNSYIYCYLFYRKCSPIELKLFEHLPQMKLKGERKKTGHFSNFLSLDKINICIGTKLGHPEPRILHPCLAPLGD